VAPPRILLVDDDTDICQFLATLLELEGMEPVVSPSPDEALSALPGADAVLLDVAMPKVDGLELCRRMRGGGFAGPIVVLSARPGPELPARAAAAGASAFVRKPFENAELVEMLRALLEAR
jgi:DNA-binding response OmpR family regulator